jgi:EAL domain-containing protein (putative c-di-GMP-specific phosphodiesterase class I)
VSRSVRDALESGDFYIAFQPVVDLATFKVFGYEGLARSHASDYPSPAQIISGAIEESYMGELGRALRHIAVTECPDYPLFLNIHPAEFDEGWLVRPDDPMSTHLHDVYLEVTETVPISYYRFCHSVLREIRSKGIMLAVDDLGAGYSNLKYIADLAPEIVKLDRQLIAGLAPRTRLHALVTSIVRLCRDLGARVVAEGIETAEELQAVIETGAHYGQGFFLARPAYPAPLVRPEALVARR